ncbi:keratin, type I cytoskeletal 9-like [Daphnia pulex]|uniref:keratin, type I cytoskeletal 9-like n=1 Tax=Daphnia pulex TaxID=6669 RepID=UPI001EDDE557|nr:keratin, type I cytoskeletal 9-like [Daphnia pulex]XP_046461255.1 keratin, type I cytoskeletal 9-like [Daphnia pulex]
MFLKAFVILPAIFSLVTAARMNSAMGSKRGGFSLEPFGHGTHHSHALKTIRSSVDSSGKANERSHPENELDSAGFGAPAYGSVGAAGFGSPVQGFGGPAGHHQGGASGFGLGSQSGPFGGPSASYNDQSGSIGSPLGSFGGPAAAFGGQSGYGGGAQGGAPGYGAAAGGYGGNSDAGMPYQFQYNVNEYGNNFGHSQSSDGNQVTGRYFVQLPDGRLQTVDFKSDPLNGYTADVQYQGQAQYPGSNNGGYSSQPSGAQYPSGGTQQAPQGNYGSGIGGGSVGQLPLAFNGQGNYGGALPSAPGSFAGPGAFSVKPY